MTQHRALNVACPTCKARKGEPCRDIRRSRVPGRKRNLSSVHPARRKLARERFNAVKQLTAEITPLVGGDKAEARQLAEDILANERSTSVSLQPKAAKRSSAEEKSKRLPKAPRVDPLSEPCPRCRVEAGQPCINLNHLLKNQFQPIQTIHVERRLAAVITWRERQKPGYEEYLLRHRDYVQDNNRRTARAIAFSKGDPHHYRGTKETYDQLGIDPSEAGARGRGSVISQLCADGDITGEELEFASEICRAHRIISGDTYLKSGDPSLDASSSSGVRWVVNNASITELVLEQSYRHLRAELATKPIEWRMLQDIVIFEITLEEVERHWVKAKKTIQDPAIDRKLSPRDQILVALHYCLQIWEDIRDRNSKPENRLKLLKENDIFFEKT